MLKLYACRPGCPIQSTLQFIAGKWKCIILYQLFKNHAMRLIDLCNAMPYTSKRMIAKQIKEMNNDNLIHKVIHPTSSIKTEYVLTEFGKSFQPIVRAMADWGYGHKKQILKISNGAKCVK